MGQVKSMTAGKGQNLSSRSARRTFERQIALKIKKNTIESLSDTQPVIVNELIVQRAYLAAGSTNLRKSIDGLAVIVQTLFQLAPLLP